MNFSQRLSGTGTTVGMAEKDIVALGAAMAGVGINAEAGGSAMSKVMSKINTAVMDGGEKLQGFAKVSNMSGQDFAKLWKSDPYAAIQQFEKGIKKTNDSGQNYKETLKSLGITELRETDTVLRLANGNKQLGDARKYADEGWKKGTALSQEAETKYKTLGNQLKIFMNHIRALGIEIGSTLAPAMIAIMKILTPVIDALAKAPGPVKAFIVALALIPVAAVPVLASLAAITGGMTMMSNAMATASMTAGKNSKALKLYSITMGLLTKPISTTKRGLTSLAATLRGTSKTATASSKSMQAAGVATAASGKGATKAGGMFSKLGKVFKFLLPVGGILTGVLEVIGAALAALSAPVLAVIAVIGSLVAIFVVAYKKVDWFRDGVNGLLYVFKVFGGNIIGGAINMIKGFGSAVAGVAKSVGGWVVGKFKSMWKAVAGTAYGKTVKSNFESFKQGMRTLGTASDKTNKQVSVLGKGVSKGTKDALSKYVKYSQDSTKVMAEMRLNQGKESKKLQNELKTNSEAAGNELVEQLKKRNKNNVKQLQKMLSDTKVYTGKEAEEIVNRAKKSGAEKVKKTEELNKEIAALEEKALADGKLSEKERKAIQKKYSERNKIATDELTKGQKEQRAIMSRLENNVGAINTKEAQDAIKDIISAQNKAIKEAKSKRDKLITEADDALANGTITQKEHDKIVKKVNARYKTETDAAVKEGNKAKKTIEKKSPGIENAINMDNGKAYSNAQKWWNQFTSGFNSSMSQAWSKMKVNAGKFGKNFVDGMMDIGAWFASVKQKANSFWAGFGQAVMGGLSTAGGWIGSQSKQFADTFVNGLTNVGQWIASVKQKANSFWSGFGTALSSSAGNVGQWFVGIGGKIWGGVVQGWNTALTTSGNLWTSLINFLGTTWGTIAAWFRTKGSAFGTAVATGWKATVGVVASVFSSIWNTVKVIWAGIWGTIKYWTGVIVGGVISKWNSIKSGTSSIFGGIWTYIKGVWAGIKGTIVYWTGAIWNRVKGVWGWIKGNTVTSFTFVWNKIKGIWKGIKGTIVYWTGAVWNRIKAVWGWIKSNTASSFTYVWNKIKSVWKGIKGTIVYWSGAIWNRIKAVWGWIKKNTSTVFNAVWGTIKRIWKGIKGTIAYWTSSIWNKIKSVWGTIRKHTSNVFNSIWNTLKRIWKGIKNTTAYWVGALWNKVRDTWNTIKKRTSSIYGSIKSIIVNAWKYVKSHSVDLITGMWSKISGVFKNMKNGVKSFAGKIKGHINDMVGGIKSGLNSLIKGVNWVAGKLGIESKIPKLHTGTEHTNTTSNIVKNGAISTPTLATVNDKGRGNGSGPNGHQEVIQKADGSMYAPKGRDVTVPLDKGDIVHNGKSVQKAQRKGLLPKFARGTGGNTDVAKAMLKSSKKKKHKHEPSFDAGAMMGRPGQGGAKEILDTITGAAKSGGKKIKDSIVKGAAKGGEALSNTKNALGAAGNWAKEKAGDLLDYVSNPGKLVDKVLKEFGVDFSMVKGEIPKTLWGGMWKRLKGGVSSLFSSWLDDASAGEGDGSFIKYLDNITTPYSPNGPPKGYPFSWAHPGIDLPYHNEVVQTPLGGTIKTGEMPNGFGHYLRVMAKPYDAYFGHLSKWLVKDGQKVKPGDKIAISGSTGASTGPHLHFELNKHGHAANTGYSIDPVKWLKEHSGGGKKSASKWKDDIKRAAKQMKVSISSSQVDGIASMIQHESGGDAGVTQSTALKDGNSGANLAKGLLQFVPSTFKAFAVKGHKNIWSGYDQLLAFFNNSNWANDYSPGGGWGPRGHRRFAHGGFVDKHQMVEISEGNRAEMVLPLTNKTRAMQLIEQAKSYMGVKDDTTTSTTSSSNQNDVIAGLMAQNNKLLELLIQTVADKQLVVDGDSMTGVINNKQGQQYNRQSYYKGKKNK